MYLGSGDFVNMFLGFRRTGRSNYIKSCFHRVQDVPANLVSDLMRPMRQRMSSPQIAFQFVPISCLTGIPAGSSWFALAHPYQRHDFSAAPQSSKPSISDYSGCTPWNASGCRWILRRCDGSNRWNQLLHSILQAALGGSPADRRTR